MARVKGTALRASISFLESRADPDSYRDILGNLPSDARQIVDAPILQSSWYPFDVLVALAQAAKGHVPVPEGSTVSWEMGRHSSEQGLKGVYRVFLRILDPGYITRKSTQIFTAYYDSGKMELVSLENKRAEIRVDGFDQPSNVFCERLQGFMERTLELTGARDIRMAHPKCRAHGDSTCLYTGEWS